MAKRQKYCYVMLIIVFALVACSNTTQNDPESLKNGVTHVANPKPEAASTDHKWDYTLVNDIKDTAKDVPEVYDVSVVKGKEDCLVAYRVKHMARFRMQNIEKELTDTLEKRFPDIKFTVSNDYKIFLESVRLLDKVKNEKVPKDKMEDQLTKIINLSKEQT
jgi:hypothetical protein